MTRSRTHRSTAPRDGDPPAVRLLRRAGQLIGEVEDVLQTWGLTWGQYDTLRALDQADFEEPLGVRAGIEAFGEGFPRLLDALEGRGYVRRQPHPSDGRKKMVEVTPEGREALQEATLALESVEVSSLDGDPQGAPTAPAP